MGYYTRVLGTKDPDIHIDELIEGLEKEGLAAQFGYDTSGQPDKWTCLEISNSLGKVLAQLERNPIVAGKIGEEELEEFKELIQDCKPNSAVKWLTDYFDKVKVIYAFQHFNASFDDGNFEIISVIRTIIWRKTQGIIQADDEGFSNEHGYHILWQFSDKVTGKWNCAVNNELGQWQNFTMDLGDNEQREEFKNGKVPQKAVSF